MTEPLLEGLRVVDLGGDPAARAGRVLADLGATVTRVVPPSGDVLHGNVARAWNAGKEVVTLAADNAALEELLRGADIVFDSPGVAGTHQLDPGCAPDAVWVSITPFGMTGSRSSWRASDLGVMAASGNMFCTGDPDRAPVRCTEPTSYAPSGPEAAFAALTALWSGVPQRVDVSMQEVVCTANMTTPARFPQTGFRGSRRGASVGRTREIWPCKDGYVSFGLRGGKARVPSLELISKLVGADVLTSRDWHAYNINATSDEELRAIEEPIAEYFMQHTMQELYEIACETNLMLAPANTPREIYASAQLAARNFFQPDGDITRFPKQFVIVHPAQPSVEPSAPVVSNGGAWAGTRIIEFGAGAAGPIATRYFVEHGATVLRVESRTRPDFLRTMVLGPDNPHGLEGGTMYDGLNVGKRHVTLNLKHPETVALVKRLVVEWADAVAENYAPKAMKSFGLDYESLAAVRPDLVMISACLNGQTGPHKNYPGFGGQGSALAGYNALTGWADREPVGPHGTITDSLAPRFVSTALAAGLHFRRRTGRGVYLDVAQVETGSWSLAPWLLDYELDGVLRVREGNGNRNAVVHGVFPCADEDGVRDRWVAIACWTGDEAATLCHVTGMAEASDDAITKWTSTRTRNEVAELLQGHGIEAVPVNDFGDLHSDPQLAAREHFVPLVHPVMGDGLYERNGFRLSVSPGGYERSGPTLGQDNDWVFHDLLGLSSGDVERLLAEGAIE